LLFFRVRRLKSLGKNFIAPIQSIRFNALKPIVPLITFKDIGASFDANNIIFFTSRKEIV